MSFQVILSVEFVGSKSKMYPLMMIIKIIDTKRQKRLTKKFSKKMNHEEYIDILFEKKYTRHGMKRIQSKSHQIGTYNINKRSLSCFDDKMYILDDGIKNLAYGHKDTN